MFPGARTLLAACSGPHQRPSARRGALPGRRGTPRASAHLLGLLRPHHGLGPGPRNSLLVSATREVEV